VRHSRSLLYFSAAHGSIEAVAKPNRSLSGACPLVTVLDRNAFRRQRCGTSSTGETSGCNRSVSLRRLNPMSSFTVLRNHQSEE